MMEKKDKKIYIIIFAIIIGLGLIATAVTYIINGKNNSNETGQMGNNTITDNPKQLDDNPEQLDDNETQYDENNYLVEAKSRDEFVKFIKNIFDNSSKYDKFTVKYENITFNAVPDGIGFKFSIYYNDDKMEFDEDSDTDYVYDNFGSINYENNNAYVLVLQEVPVGSSGVYKLIVFDESGNLLLDKGIISNNSVTIENNIINYSTEIKMQEQLNLDVKAENDDNFCSYLNDNYKDNNYVINGNYKYEYSNNGLVLIEKNETTIKDYKNKYNCY